MRSVKDEVVECERCSLVETRKMPVVGEGSHEADIVFVGEAPGANEDETGHPFCGRSGKILTELIESVGLSRDDVYITNVLKCRPPNNRDPQKDEVVACTPYLQRQIEVVDPEVICPLGRHAMYYVMDAYGLERSSISQARGQVFEAEVTIIPFYHPAVALYSSSKKPELIEDFQVLREFITKEEKGD